MFLKSVKLWRDLGGGGWSNPVTSTTPLNSSKFRLSDLIVACHDQIDAWNRVIVEIIPAHPYAFVTGYYSGRIWINGVGMDRVYFGDFSNHLFYDINTDQIHLCSTTDPGADSIIQEANFDMLNFIWFKGSEGLHAPISTEGKFLQILQLILIWLPLDPSCALKGFINPIQTACLQCNPGYKRVEKECMSSCPTGYVLHSGTDSCQSNFNYLISLPLHTFLL